MPKGYSIIFEENKEGRCIRLTSSIGKEVNSDLLKGSKWVFVAARMLCAFAFF